MKTICLSLLLTLASLLPAISRAEMHPQLTNNVARPLRYWPIAGDFVITNGVEFFNRPLYCANSAFRVDGGDKPEFSIYLPGRGGNLRLGIQTAAGVKWLNAAAQIVTRYRAGSLLYEIHDPLLGAGELDLTVLPMSETKGLIARAELRNSAPPAKLILAFGGANGMRGHRGGDIGCEREPVSEFFQLHPRECRGNKFIITTNTFVLHSRPATLAGIFPIQAKLQIADATKWNSAADLLASAKPGLPSRRARFEYPILIGQTRLTNDEPIYFAVKKVSPLENVTTVSSGDLPRLFSAAENHRRKIADQVTVKTPDPFINAAVPALNIAADAIWDARQKAFMHGAVAWRVRLLGWRGLYTGDALGWHQRTAEHFAGFAREQNTNPIPKKIPPADKSSNLARNETALHSNGDLTKSHYDMNLVAVDGFFRHLLWTGDTNYARKWWPVIERHFAWERRLFRRKFGPDKLPLYEAYAAIWASDNLGYNGGGTAHASAYNYFANKMAARVAKMIGKNPQPYAREANLIWRGMQKYLWLTNDGCFAEYRDYLGLQRAHPSGGLWTYYITMDSQVPTPLEAWRMSRWVNHHIAHIPIELCRQRSNDMLVPFSARTDRKLLHCPAQEQKPFVMPESNWMPYEWSLNNVVVAENMHTSLGFWEANRPKTAFALFKGAMLDTMFLGLCPGNVGAMTSHDAARGESQRDFADGIGTTSRALVQGLFGVKPDALAGDLKIVPGFPSDWSFATMHHPDFNFAFHRNGGAETYAIKSKFPKPMLLRLQIRALRNEVASVTVNGVPAKWQWLKGIYGPRRIEIRSGRLKSWKVVIKWKGGPIRPRVPTLAVNSNQGLNRRKRDDQKSFNWKRPFAANVKFITVKLTPYFNDRVTQIFKNQYRSPRSPFCSLAMPMQGLGGWADDKEHFTVDDAGLRAVAARHGGKIVLPDGVPLATPTNAAAKNILFTSQWNNYADSASLPLTGKASRAFLLMAGSTDPMQSRFNNGEVIVTYADGSTTKLLLRNPTNWWPIDQDYFIDDYAFRRPGPIPPRVDLKTGKIRLLKVDTFKGKGGTVPGGVATVLEISLNPNKKLKSLTVRALANEVVIGLMSVTLER